MMRVVTTPDPSYGPPDPSTPPQGGYPPPPQQGGYPPPPPQQQIYSQGPGDSPYGVDAYGRPLSDKNKVVAGLLSIFLGTFGIGRFYLGYTGLGIAMLLLSWLTFGIWPLIDGILILLGKVTDKEGRTLRD